VVSAGEGPLVGPGEGGDEPVALARRLTGVLIVVGERRAEAARRAADLGADLLILDDAYQHLSVRRDANLLLLDSREPFGGGLPPGGRLREPAEAIERADAIVWTRVERGSPPAEALRIVARHAPGRPVFHARFRAAGLFGEDGGQLDPASLSRRPTIAVCGVARADSFSASLSELGVTPEELLAFRDHQRYRERHLARIRRAADRAGAEWIVTTEKDAVKLQGRTSLPMLTLRLSVEVEEPGFFPFLSARLDGGGGAR
jgi:tetraacyldisaccharide 4'-kinase